MPLLKIARMGHPVLRNRAAPVADPEDAEIRRLAADMIDTMTDARGVGIAAPQVYRGLRMIAVMSGLRGEAPPEVEILINPMLEILDEGVEVEMEGCLSIPELRGMVPRARRVGYAAIGLDGRRIEREAEGFDARILQHEVDHLDGILYLDRMRDFATLTFESEMHHLTEEDLGEGAAMGVAPGRGGRER